MDPLAQLKDIHLPAPVGFWPVAMGWIVLFLLCFMGFIFVLWKIIRGWTLFKARRYLLHRLKQLKIEYANKTNPVEIAIALSQLLRRAALTVFPRNDVASLKSEAWLAFLDRTGETTAFTQGAGRALIYAPYQSAPTYNVEDLFTIVNNWVKHNVPSFWGRR